MAVTEPFDRDVRRRLAAELVLAPEILDLGVVDEDRGVWKLSPESAAQNERRIAMNTFPYFVAEINERHAGIDLPLTQARSFLGDAAASLKGIGRLTSEIDARVRFAAIGALARGCTERASTIRWVFEDQQRSSRLRRSLLVEIKGLEQLLKLLPRIRKEVGDDRDLVHMTSHLLEIAKMEVGGYELDRRGALLSIGGETLPSYTRLVAQATTSHSYAELSVHTHPTGHLHVASSEWSSGGQGQARFAAKSTVHDEGRLSEPALLSFSRAVGAVAHYIGASSDDIRAWGGRIVGVWAEWCMANGCA